MLRPHPYPVAHFIHGTTSARGYCSHHRAGSHRYAQSYYGHLLSPSVPKRCYNMPHPQCSKPNRCAWNISCGSREETLRTSHTPRLRVGGGCMATAPTSAVKCFHPQVPTVFLTKPRGWWEGNALFCVAGNNRGKSSNAELQI